MNLMFWKKKPSPQEDAGDTAPGLFARMKTRVTALTGRFKSPPPFQAEAPNTNAAATESAQIPDPAQSAPRSPLQRLKAAIFESSPRTRLIAGGAILLLLLGALGFATWSILKSSPDPGDNLLDIAGTKKISSARAIDRPGSEPAATESLAESAIPQTNTSDQEASALPHPADIPASAPAVTEHAIGTTIVPVEPAHDKSPASTAPPAHPLAKIEHPAPASHTPAAGITPEAEIAALKKEKAKLERELNALKNAQRRAATAGRPQGRQAPALGGSVTVPSNDPKATADTLKSAIEAMNAGTGDHQKKPAK